MTKFILCLGLGLGLAGAVAWHGMAQDGGPSPKEKERIEALVKKLASNRYVDREKARMELEKIGLPALEALRAASKSNDLEVSGAASKLLGKLEEQLFTANLLTPKRVRLQVENVLIMEAVKELSRLSGYDIQVQGDRTPLAGKKITLDTGETTFWQALDQLCTKAGLVEYASNAPRNPRPRFPRDGIRPPIGIQPVPVPIQIQPLPAIQIGPGKILVPEKENPPILEKIEQLKRAKAKKNFWQNNGPFLPILPEDAQGTASGEKETGKKADSSKEKGNLKEKEARQAKEKAAREEARRRALEAKAMARNAQAAAQFRLAQFQPAQVQIGGGQVIIGGDDVQIGGRMPPNSNGGSILLMAGTPKKIPTYYAGAIRFQVVNAYSAQGGQGNTLEIMVSPEPGLLGFALQGSPTIDTALDDKGQKWDLIPNKADPNNPPQGRVFYGNPYLGGGSQQVTLRFKTPEKASQVLKKLSGKVTAQMLTPPQKLVVIPNVLKAGEKKAKGKNGEILQIVTVEKRQNTGEYVIRVTMEGGTNPFGNALQIGGGAAVQINGNVVINGPGGPVQANNLELLDAKGNPYRLVQIPSRMFRGINGQISQDITMVFRPNPGQGEPDSLILSGRRSATVTIPFEWENVTLRQE